MGSEKLQRPRPPHHHHRHRPRVRRRRQAAAPRALERQGGDRDAEGRPHLPAVAVAAAQARTTSSATRSARTSRRASKELLQGRLAQSAPPRDRARLPRARCSCRNDAGSRGVTGPSIIRSTHRAFVDAGRQQHDPPARGESSPSPSTALRAARRRRGCRTARALARRVAGVRRVRCVRATSARAGSLKPMWPLQPEAENLQVDAAGALDRALVADAFALDVAPPPRRSESESGAAAG